MRVLLTRPYEDSLRTAVILKQRGIDSIIEPLFSPVDHQRVFTDLDRYQALIFTSRHAVRFFAEHNRFPECDVYCVGDETAAFATGLGAMSVFSANGNAGDLAALIKTSCNPEHGPLLRLKCKMPVDLLSDQLLGAGFTVEQAIIYTPFELLMLSNDNWDIIKDGPLDGVLFYSPGNAASFGRLMKQFSLTKACRRLTAWCISEATATALPKSLFGTIKIAPKPTQDSLLSLLNQENTS